MAGDLNLEDLNDLSSCYGAQKELDQGKEESHLSININNKQHLMRRDWSQLPRDINNLIADKLGFIPHLQKFGAACRDWRDIAYQMTKIVPSRPPLLFLPYNQDTQIATFFDIKNSKMYDLKMPELQGNWICGASNGLLAFIDINLHIFLLNPFTRAHIKLPPLHPPVVADFHKMLNVTDISHRKYFINKVVLSCDPSSSDCLIAVIYSDYLMLGVCRLGDEYWSVEVPYLEWRDYVDVIFYQGKIFAVQLGKNIQVFEYHKQGDLRMLKAIEHPIKNPKSLMMNLVECYGDLFHIIGAYTPSNAWRFEIYKFEPNSENEKQWSRLYSLDDRSLFLGPNGCICMSVKESWCKPNCIYFIYYPNLFLSQNLFRSDEYQWVNGIYSLDENRMIAKFVQHTRLFRSPPPIWF